MKTAILLWSAHYSILAGHYSAANNSLLLALNICTPQQIPAIISAIASLCDLQDDLKPL